MSTCPHCGASTGNGGHMLADIKWDFVGSELVIKSEVWKCRKTNATFSGNLDDDTSDETRKDYETRKILYWSLQMENISQAIGMPIEPKRYIDIAACYEQLGDYKVALSWLDKALEVNPNNCECNYKKGLVLVKQRKPDLARLEFIRAAQNGHIESQEFLMNNNL